MKVIKINGELLMCQDDLVPDKFADLAVHVDDVPAHPDDGNAYDLDLVDGQLVWVPRPVVEPTQEERITSLEEENKILKERVDNIEAGGGDDVWNEMDAAYQEGVNSAYDQ